MGADLTSQHSWVARGFAVSVAPDKDGSETTPASSRAGAPSLFLLFTPDALGPAPIDGLPRAPTGLPAASDIRSLARSSPCPTLQQPGGRVSLADMSLRTIKPSMLKQLAGPPLSPGAEGTSSGRPGAREVSGVWTEAGSYFTAIGTFRGSAALDDEDGEVVLELWEAGVVDTSAGSERDKESEAAHAFEVASDARQAYASVRSALSQRSDGASRAASSILPPPMPHTLRLQHALSAAPLASPPRAPPDPAEPTTTLRDHAERAFWAFVMPSISELVAWSEYVQSGLGHVAALLPHAHALPPSEISLRPHYHDDTVYTLRFPAVEGGEYGPTLRPVLVRKRTGLPAFDSGYDDFAGGIGRLGSRR
ncbi:hypothetical protein Q5752_000659 [Cryptotrichosporon argae]